MFLEGLLVEILDDSLQGPVKDVAVADLGINQLRRDVALPESGNGDPARDNVALLVDKGLKQDISDSDSSAAVERKTIFFFIVKFLCCYVYFFLF